MTNEASVSPSCNQSETSTTNLDHQLLKISIPHTELDVFGPGFIEVSFRLYFYKKKDFVNLYICNF